LEILQNEHLKIKRIDYDSAPSDKAYFSEDDNPFSKTSFVKIPHPLTISLEGKVIEELKAFEKTGKSEAGQKYDLRHVSDTCIEMQIQFDEDEEDFHLQYIFILYSDEFES